MKRKQHKSQSNTILRYFGSNDAELDIRKEYSRNGSDELSRRKITVSSDFIAGEEATTLISVQPNQANENLFATSENGGSSAATGMSAESVTFNEPAEVPQSDPVSSVSNEIASDSDTPSVPPRPMPSRPDSGNNYKRKCVEMSCIISNKALKIGKLERDNDTLKRTVQLFNPELEFGLDEKDLKEMSQISEAGHADMTFVRTAIMKMYKNDLGKLENKTLRGKKPRPYKKKDGTVLQKEQKEPLTPAKLEKIRCLFGKRVGTDGHRFNSFNKHVTNSLQRIQERLRNPARKLVVL